MSLRPCNFFKNLQIVLTFASVLILFSGRFIQISAKLEVVNLRTEYKVNPVGIDINKPRLSWEIVSNQRGIMQSAYHIRVAEKEKDLKNGQNLLWDTGIIKSDKSNQLKFNGPPLSSGQRLYWSVRIWDQDNKSSEWSKVAYWEMGLLEPTDWEANWIQANIEEDVQISNPPHLFRKEFEINKVVKKARAYVTCLGLYEMELNGEKIGDQVFTPGWTSYKHRLQYQTYDISRLLKSGKNAIGIMIGDGWYRGRFGFRGRKNLYGEKLALLAQFEIEYEDGEVEIIGTDDSWKASTGPILMSNIYDGEIYDARLEKEGWSLVGYDDSDWSTVKIINHSKDILIAPEGPPVRKMKEIKPIAIFKTAGGKTIADMGQNMVGWIRIKVKGEAGTTVTLKHAEVLDKDGNIYTENLRSAKQTIQYTLKGSDLEVNEPHFTFQGFRYVQVEGYPGELTLESLTGIVIHSDFELSGIFECSNPLLNQLQQNIQWGQRGNFLDVPTDCPQRDERMGWTGDAQVFARTACFNADLAAFYTKWMKDMSADQQNEGEIPHVVPDVISNNRKSGASAGWADAAVIIPWTIYLCYGDTRILEQQYQSMKAWVTYMKNKAGDSYFWNTDFTFGDWLAFNTNRSDYPGATTDKDFISQAYFARSTDLLRKIAIVLGKNEDAMEYSNLLKKIKIIFQDEFITKNGRLSPNTQTAYALALGFGLVPEAQCEIAAKRLADDVNKFQHITTGFLGTPLICHVLSDFGYYEEAFMLLNRKEYPSWLYPITMGATTIWERWDGIKPDSTFQDKGMNSFNHYAYGAIGEWLYRVVAGIEIDEKNPGYKHTIIHPHSGGNLSYAKASVHSLYGKVASGWSIAESIMKVLVEIPPNTFATLKLPNARLEQVRENGKSLEKVEGIQEVIQEERLAIIKLGSGNYTFEYGVNN